MRLCGKVNELYYRLPVIGKSLVVALNRIAGHIIFYTMFSWTSRRKSIHSVRKVVIQICNMMKISIEMPDNEAGPDGFEFFVDPCPYGFHREDQQGVCDAAMDLDRVIFRHLGAELIIRESIPGGAPKCRIWMNWTDT